MIKENVSYNVGGGDRANPYKAPQVAPKMMTRTNKTYQKHTSVDFQSF